MQCIGRAIPFFFGLQDLVYSCSHLSHLLATCTVGMSWCCGMKGNACTLLCTWTDTHILASFPGSCRVSFPGSPHEPGHEAQFHIHVGYTVSKKDILIVISENRQWFSPRLGGYQLLVNTLNPSLVLSHCVAVSESTGGMGLVATASGWGLLDGFHACSYAFLVIGAGNHWQSEASWSWLPGSHFWKKTQLNKIRTVDAWF